MKKYFFKMFHELMIKIIFTRLNKLFEFLQDLGLIIHCRNVMSGRFHGTEEFCERVKRKQFSFKLTKRLNEVNKLSTLVFSVLIKFNYFRLYNYNNS